MSDEESFLKRWSRRKLAATEPQAPAEPEQKDGAPEPEKVADAGKGAAPEFDLTSLPSLDEIGPGTKVDVFMRKGVPPELSRAALRRAWVSDPEIRDFVGLSENSWDFNASEGVPGFGPLEMTDDLKRIVSQMFTPTERGGEEVAPPPQISAIETGAVPASEPAGHAAPEIVDSQSPDLASKQNEVAQVPNNSTPSIGEPVGKSQQSKEEKSASESVSTYESITKLTRRGHGGAMPR